MGPEGIAKEIVRIATDSELVEIGDEDTIVDAVRAVVIRNLHPDPENSALMRLVEAANVIGFLARVIESMHDTISDLRGRSRADSDAPLLPYCTIPGAMLDAPAGREGQPLHRPEDEGEDR